MGLLILYLYLIGALISYPFLVGMTFHYFQGKYRTLRDTPGERGRDLRFAYSWSLLASLVWFTCLPIHLISGYYKYGIFKSRYDSSTHHDERSPRERQNDPRQGDGRVRAGQ